MAYGGSKPRVTCRHTLSAVLHSTCMPLAQTPCTQCKVDGSAVSSHSVTGDDVEASQQSLAVFYERTV